MDDLIRAAGFQLNDIETGYMNGPKPMTFMYQGQAILSSGSYFPPPVRRVDIPKADSGTRPLGIPTVADRVAQEIARRYLEPCLEGENFSETSPCVPDFTIGDLPDRLPGFAVMNDRGAVLVEYAILLPVIVSVIFGGLDMSLATITAGRLQFAAEATSRCVVIGNTLCATRETAQTYLTNALGAPPSVFTVNPGQPCGTVVSASYNYVPFILPASMIPTLNATACYP
jgi:hypothetical protein